MIDLTKVSANMQDILEELNKTNKELKLLNNNVIEQKQANEYLIQENKSLKNEINFLKNDVKQVRVYLDENNRNKKGRPCLTDNEILMIKELHNQGFSMRKVAEMVDVSVGSVSKYSNKNEKVENILNKMFEETPEQKENNRKINECLKELEALDKNINQIGL